MSRRITITWVLLALIGAGMITALPSHAQEPVRLDASVSLPGRRRPARCAKAGLKG